MNQPAKHVANLGPDGDVTHAALGELPLLSITFLFAAVGDLLFNSVFLRFIALEWSRSWRIDLARYGDLLPNLAALAGSVVFLVGAWELVRSRGIPNYERLLISLASGLFIPNVLLSTLMPISKVTHLLVIAGIGAAGFVTLVFIMIALQHAHRSRSIYISGAVFLLFSLASTTVFFSELGRHSNLFEAPAFIMKASELSFFLVSICLGAAALLGDGRRMKVKAITFALTALVVIGALVTMQRHWSPDELMSLLTISVHVREFAAQPVLYALGLPFALGVLVASLWTRGPRRQLSLAAWVFFVAGARPDSVKTALFYVVSSLLIARFALSSHSQPNLVSEKTEK